MQILHSFSFGFSFLLLNRSRYANDGTPRSEKTNPDKSTEVTAFVLQACRQLRRILLRKDSTASCRVRRMIKGVRGSK